MAEDSRVGEMQARWGIADISEFAINSNDISASPPLRLEIPTYPASKWKVRRKIPKLLPKAKSHEGRRGLKLFLQGFASSPNTSKQLKTFQRLHRKSVLPQYSRYIQAKAFQ